MTRRMFAQSDENMPALVMRVATFSSGHRPLDEYREFIDAHLFPMLPAVSGYVAAFLFRICNRQILNCHGCQECQRRRGTLLVVAR